MSYGALAAKIGMPKAVRAVGHANGANPLSVVVPCHRLIGADGSLVKYGGGLERKRWLLEHEGVALSCVPRLDASFVPSAEPRVIRASVSKDGRASGTLMVEMRRGVARSSPRARRVSTPPAAPRSLRWRADGSARS